MALRRVLRCLKQENRDLAEAVLQPITRQFDVQRSMPNQAHTTQVKVYEDLLIVDALELGMTVEQGPLAIKARDVTVSAPTRALHANIAGSLEA